MIVISHSASNPDVNSEPWTDSDRYCRRDRPKAVVILERHSHDQVPQNTDSSRRSRALLQLTMLTTIQQIFRHPYQRELDDSI